MEARTKEARRLIRRFEDDIVKTIRKRNCW
jgi:hypothetical protein